MPCPAGSHAPLAPVLQMYKAQAKKLKRRAKKGLPTTFDFLDPMGE